MLKFAPQNLQSLYKFRIFVSCFQFDGFFFVKGVFIMFFIFGVGFV